jgi:16S rRNA (cytosine1402-N4)-methyltransferase
MIIMPLPSSMVNHTPVMIREIIGSLSPHDGAVYVDATFGAGGYSEAILNAADCTVWGIDRDPAIKARSIDLQRRFKGRLTVLNGPFGDMVRLLSKVGVEKIDGVALDLGVSSMQIDNAERGFSFRADGPLDMRMEQSGMTAAEVVNQLREEELANIIYHYGEERLSRRIAKAIVKSRSETPITRTSQLASLVRSIVKKSKDGIDPATRTFQALRIFVNDELGELDRGLKAAEVLLRPGFFSLAGRSSG